MSSIVLPQIADETYSARWIENLPNEKYHSDKSHVGSTDLRRVRKSPWTFYQAMRDSAMPVLEEEDSSDALRLGEVFHMAVLEPKKFFSRYVKMPEFIGKTKDGRDSANSAAAKEKKAEWLSAQHKDAVLLSEKEMAQIEGMVNSVLSHRDACGLLKQGSAEITGYYRDPLTGIQCKIRPDFINFEMMTLVDVKTTRDCTAEGFQKSITNFAYHFQMAMYCEGVRHITGRAVNYPIYLAVEKTPPYEVALYVADDTILFRGNEEYQSALRMLQECLFKNQWPKYQASLQPIGLPTWMLKG